MYYVNLKKIKNNYSNEELETKINKGIEYNIYEQGRERNLTYYINRNLKILKLHEAISRFNIVIVVDDELFLATYETYKEHLKNKLIINYNSISEETFKNAYNDFVKYFIKNSHFSLFNNNYPINAVSNPKKSKFGNLLEKPDRYKNLLNIELDNGPRYNNYQSNLLYLCETELSIENRIIEVFNNEYGRVIDDRKCYYIDDEDVYMYYIDNGFIGYKKIEKESFFNPFYIKS